MADFGPSTVQVDQLIARASHLTPEEAADLYESHAARLLIYGSDAHALALVRARKAARRTGLEPEYIRARHAAVTAWRRALPPGQGPWLLVGEAIASAAGALVVYRSLDEKAVQLLLGPWRQALGTALEPVGPGVPGRVLEPSVSRIG